MLHEAEGLATAEGDHERALELANRVALERLADERACRLSMRLLMARHDRAGALVAFERCRDALATQLGAGPSPATASLHRSVLLTRDDEQERLPLGEASAAAVLTLIGIALLLIPLLRRTWRESARFLDFRRMLACGCLYQAGIAVVIALAAVYAEQAMKFTTLQTMVLIFVVNVAAALGAFGFGYAQDRVGHRRALALTLVGWIAMVAIAALTRDVGAFWAAAGLAGLCMGSSQSCGRAMIGARAPAGQSCWAYLETRARGGGRWRGRGRDAAPPLVSPLKPPWPATISLDVCAAPGRAPSHDIPS
jgi:hypothetical protein